MPRTSLSKGVFKKYEPVKCLRFETFLFYVEFRKYDDIYEKLRTADLQDIFNLTGCLKPCQYKKYSFLGEKEPSLIKLDNAVAFSLWAVSNTRVSREQLIYPMASLIAEFGGALSLFLGVSFITPWDNFRLISALSKVIYANVPWE